MANSLFISCAFSRPERTYDNMAKAIDSLGVPSVEIHFGLWHIKTTKTVTEVRDRLKPAVDVNDQIVVIDASNAKLAWLQLAQAAERRLREVTL